MVDYNELRKKFPSKTKDKAARDAKIRAIAHEYERKKAALGAKTPLASRGFPYYMVILIGMMLVGALVIPQILSRGPGGASKAQKAQENVRKDLHTLAIALGRYRYHTGFYPTTEQGLEQLAVKKLTRKDPVEGWNGPYIRQLKPDPWGHAYVYAENGEGEPPALYSLGPDGAAGTTDDILVNPEDFDEPFKDTGWTKGWMPQHLRGYVVAQTASHKEQLESEVEAILNPGLAALGRTVLTDGWEFAQAWKDTLPESGKTPHDDPGFASEALTWRPVRVPHDWAIEGPFDPSCPKGGAAKLPCRGVGYYRRTLTVTEKAKGKFIALRFNGVMARPEVYLNGEKVGGWDYGYMSFEVDISDKVRFGQPNTLVVRVDTSAMRSRWYPGAGIIRPVALVIEEATERLIADSLQITALSISDELAKMRAVYRTPLETVTNDFEVAQPILWSPTRPYLYRYRLFGQDYKYGIRTATFTANDGFHLNGRRLQLKGVNLHSDFGPLGAIYDREAARRILTTMKDMGVNAVRTSHNPVDPDFLDLCDEMGFVVWDEGFDKWDDTAGIKPDEDQDEIVMRNLRALVRRDRNHPSVVCWSIGNEIKHRTEEYPSGTDEARCAKYRAAVLQEDATRPVGIGCCFTDSIKTGDYAALDLTGWNYHGQYREMKAAYPDKPVVYSESASAYSSFGFYETEITTNPLRYEGDKSVTAIDSYDRTSAPWADLADVEFARMEADRYCAGEFVWTGVDYLGEPTPNVAVNRSSFFGICDLTGLPKDRYYLYRSQWNDTDKTIHLLPHWNWPGREGQKIPVFCYTDGDEAELFLNGDSLGKRKKAATEPVVVDKKHPDYYKVTERYRLRWDVPYEPGTLKVIVYKKGNYHGETTMQTAMKPEAVRLTAERKYLAEDELTAVTVEIVDAFDTVEPLAQDEVAFTLEGPGEIVAVGNASTSSMKSFTDVAAHPLYNGRAVVFVRRTKGSGKPIVLKASVKGLRTAQVQFLKR